MNMTLWNQTKKYLLPYDGGASQIHILEIPKVETIRVFNVIKERIIEPRFSLLSSELIEENIYLKNIKKFNDVLKKSQTGQTTINGNIFSDADLNFDFWAKESKDTFDLEIWFWADQMFPGDDSLNCSRFDNLISLIKLITNQMYYRCILTTCEAGDPLEDLNKGQGIEINLCES